MPLSTRRALSRIFLVSVLFVIFAATSFPQTPPIEPGVSQELAKWRAARYSDIRYKLNLTLEKMSPVLRGTIEIRVKVATQAETRPVGSVPPIILDWRKISGHENLSMVTNVYVNGELARTKEQGVQSARPTFQIVNDHLTVYDGVVLGENVIKLDFTSPILTSGAGVTRYIDREDGSEYIYSLFVPSDASTAFPVFDQPDLKAGFSLFMTYPRGWKVVANAEVETEGSSQEVKGKKTIFHDPSIGFYETKPISTYVFAFAAGPFKEFRYQVGDLMKSADETYFKRPRDPNAFEMGVFVRKSQAAKFQPHARDVYNLNREAFRFFEEYFNYKFPFPKYDLVLIPEFPFGGMEHAGATFLRESAIIFPQEPTRNDHISRALLIFHEASHQWFGDTVTMRWFDDLWLKEGFATFTAYKAMERIMPEMLAWKVFYERVKQAAYQTDSTKGTTPIYQEIKNLSAAKSAYGNIVYNKAPAFLRQAEFYLGEDKFQTAVRAVLKKHEFGNAGWEDLVKEFETATVSELTEWAEAWITKKGVPMYRGNRVVSDGGAFYHLTKVNDLDAENFWLQRIEVWTTVAAGRRGGNDHLIGGYRVAMSRIWYGDTTYIFPNEEDYGYGIFLLDDKSREYVLKNIHNEKDPFLRSMMWGALWDSVREAELDPKVYVELAVKNLPAETDETIGASVLSRVTTAINYYLDENAKADVTRPFEEMLEREMLNGNSAGRRITFYRGFLSVGASIRGRQIYKKIFDNTFWPKPTERNGVVFGESREIPLKAKDRFDIVTRLLILRDPDAPKLLAELEKTETSDDAKRYAYAARAGIATAENKAKYWNDFVNNKEISESWIEAALVPWNSIRQSELTLPYLEKALTELPNHKRSRKIFFVNGWLAAFIGDQRSEQALGIVNKFLADNPNLDNDLRLKVLENLDIIERAVKIRKKYSHGS